PAGQLALGVGQHLAVLSGDDRGQPVGLALDQVAEAEQHPGAHMRRGRGPAGESLGGGIDRSAALFGGGKGNPAGYLAAGRVIDIAEAAGPPGHALAVHEMRYLSRHAGNLLYSGVSRLACPAGGFTALSASPRSDSNSERRFKSSDLWR